MMLQSSLAHSLNTQYGIPSDPVAVCNTRQNNCDFIRIILSITCLSSIKLANVIIHLSQNAIFIICWISCYSGKVIINFIRSATVKYIIKKAILFVILNVSVCFPRGSVGVEILIPGEFGGSNEINFYPEYCVLYPLPLRWWKYFATSLCVTLLRALHIVIKLQLFLKHLYGLGVVHGHWQAAMLSQRGHAMLRVWQLASIIQYNMSSAIFYCYSNTIKFYSVLFSDKLANCVCV